MSRGLTSPNSYSHPHLESLVSDMNQFFLLALAPTTRSTYRSGLRSYKLFCLQLSLVLFPLSELNLQLFVTSSASRVSYSTIKVYLCGIQYESIIRGYPEKISSMVKLYYVLRGIRRTQGSKWTKQKRLPITPSHLRSMLYYIHNSKFSSHDKAMWSCLILVAFFGLMRVSEYVCPSSSSFNPDLHLSTQDISFSSRDSVAIIRIKASKTDPFRVGTSIRLVAIGGDLCPVHALKNFLSVKGSSSGPLFALTMGDFVTRKYVSALLSISLPSLNLDTHSFRIGGASAAASCGIPDSVIKILGRWSSDCYRRYLRLPDHVVKDWLIKTSNLKDINKIWDISSI